MDKTVRQPGFAQVDNRIVSEYAARIGLSALGVYLALCRYADGTTRTCYPSHYTLARVLGVSRTTVIRAIGRLEKAGLVEVRRRRTERGDPCSNEYKLVSLAGKNTGVSQGDPRVTEVGSRAREAAQDVGWGSSVSIPQAVHHADHPSTETAREQDSINKTQLNNLECRAPAPPPYPTPIKAKRAGAERMAGQEAPSCNPAPRGRDPHLDHPAVQAYHRECKLTPNEAQRAEIAARVTDVAAWEQVMKQWLLLGYRKNNVAGMLDWYKKGIPERSHGHGNHGVGSGLGSFGHRAGGGYKPRPRETPEERARLDAEWESLARRAGSMAGIDDGGEV